MIIKLELQNFKSLIDNEINLAPLTFFTGLNSSGKSSFLQALRLLAGEQREILDQFNQIFHIRKCLWFYQILRSILKIPFKLRFFILNLD